jgi:two-component system OmpR family response regulator
MRWLLLGIDADIAGGLDLVLRPQGHHFTWCRHSAEGIAIDTRGHHAVVVEWPGPEGADMGWLERIRQQHPHTRLLVLTTASQIAARARHLARVPCTLILKPVAVDILAQQLQALAAGADGLASTRRHCGEVDFDLERRTAVRRGTPVLLTTREWMLLETLLQGGGRAIPKEELAARVIFDSESPANAVEVHLSNIRRKLGRELIQTIRSRGYRIRS